MARIAGGMREWCQREKKRIPQGYNTHGWLPMKLSGKGSDARLQMGGQEVKGDGSAHAQCRRH